MAEAMATGADGAPPGAHPAGRGGSNMKVKLHALFGVWIVQR
jgi:hypothetical protein